MSIATALLVSALFGGPAARPIDAASFKSPAYDGSVSQLRKAMRRAAPTQRVRSMSFSGDGLDRNCHTQAISVAQDVVMTSCVDKRRSTGWLQIYSRRQDRPRSFGDTEGVRLDGDRFPHAAVGQAVIGRGDAEGEVLVPIGREPLELFGADRHSLLEIRNRDGELLCHVTNDRRGGLAATALVATKGALYAMAVTYLDILVWRIDGVRDDGRCDAERVFAQASHSAAGEAWVRYQGIAALVDRYGDVIFFGGRHHQLDMWALRGFGTPDMTFEQIGSMEWRPPEAVMLRRGVFHEGMSVEPLGDKVRIWALPHDFWRGTCVPASSRRRCNAVLYYIEQSFDAPELSWR